MKITRPWSLRDKRSWPGWTWLLTGLVAVAWRLGTPTPGLDQAGWLKGMDTLTTLAWFMYVFILALGLGRRLLRSWQVNVQDRLEQVLLAGGVGAGGLAIGLFFLASAGLLSKWGVLLLVAAFSLVVFPDCVDVLHAFRSFPGRLVSWFKGLKPWQQSIAVYGALVFVMAGCLALAPPTHYDVLMYHLPAAEQFLEAGRWLVLPDLWQANLPFLGEMLFMVGLSLHSPAFAGLVHLAFGVGLVGMAIALARQVASPNTGWVASVSLMGVWALPLWAAFALVDLGWAFYIGAAGLALLHWQRNSEQNRWLALAAVFTGLALGVKSLALFNGLALGLWVLWVSRKSGIKNVLKRATMFAGIALALGLPWYLKNWLLAGNPIYPALFGGPGWDAQRVSLLQSYLDQFGGNRTWQDVLLLPFSLYLNPAPFATLQRYEVMSWMFPLALAVPFFPRRREMNNVGLLAIGQYLAWIPGSLQIRFLLPLFPFLAVLSGEGFMRLVRIPLMERWFRAIGGLLLVGIMIGSLVFTTLAFTFFAPIGNLLGLETSRAYLARTVDNFPAWETIQQNLEPSAVVFPMWDGRVYYCSRCLPDGDQARWTRLVLAHPTVEGITQALAAEHVTHLLLSKGDADFFANRLGLEPHAQALEFFTRHYQSACTRTLYEDDHALLVEISCLP